MPLPHHGTMTDRFPPSAPEEEEDGIYRVTAGSCPVLNRTQPPGYICPIYEVSASEPPSRQETVKY